jgi:hypothetical protein
MRIRIKWKKMFPNTLPNTSALFHTSTGKEPPTSSYFDNRKEGILYGMMQTIRNSGHM